MALSNRFAFRAPPLCDRYSLALACRSARAACAQTRREHGPHSWSHLVGPVLSNEVARWPAFVGLNDWRRFSGLAVSRSRSSDGPFAPHGDDRRPRAVGGRVRSGRTVTRHLS
eukprot:1195449-Prorocentrum_minimum.AAC.3